MTVDTRHHSATTQRTTRPIGVLSLLAGHLRPIRVLMVAGIVLTVFGTFAQLAQPLTTGAVLAALEEGRPLTRPVLVLLVVLAATIVCNWAGSQCLLKATEDVVASTRRRLVDRILSLTIPGMHTQNPGDLMSRVTSDAGMIRVVALQCLTQVVTGLIMVVGSLIIMAQLNYFLLTVTIAVIVLPASFLLGVMPRVRHWSRRSQQAVGAIGAELERNLGNLTMVKANLAERSASERLAERIDVARSAGVATAFWRSTSGSVALLTMQASYIAVLVTGGVLVQQDRLEISMLVSFLMYAMQLAQPVVTLTAAASAFQLGRAALERMAEVEELEVEAGSVSLVGDTAPKATADGVDKPGGLGTGGAASWAPAARFTSVSFGYPGVERPVLHRLSLDVPENGRVALVGASGCGKSTVLRLLAGLYSADTGSIAVGGRDLRYWDLAELRRSVAYLEQGAPVVEGSVRENLLFGDSGVGDIDDVRLQEVLTACSLGGRFPDLDSAVGYRGGSLSGGEQQRLSLARGLLREPRLLLLDEATSALDTTTEIEVMRTIAEVAKRIPVVMVAHRLATVVDCERVVVMQSGRVRASGTHSELLATDGYYRELVASGLGADEPGESGEADQPDDDPDHTSTKPALTSTS